MGSPDVGKTCDIQNFSEEKYSAMYKQTDN